METLKTIPATRLEDAESHPPDSHTGDEPSTSAPAVKMTECFAVQPTCEGSACVDYQQGVEHTPRRPTQPKPASQWSAADPYE